MRKEEQELRAQVRARIAGMIVREERRDAPVSLGYGNSSDRSADEAEMIEWNIEIFLCDFHPVRIRMPHPCEPDLDQIISMLLLHPDALVMVLGGCAEG